METTVGNAVTAHDIDFVFFTTSDETNRSWEEGLDDGADELNVKLSIPPANTPRYFMSSDNAQAETDRIVGGALTKLQMGIKQ
ncbi:hypothetical protein D9613_004270 [Agrocybe pediades]|uniref:Uncharacterized protein n=1 Tax=Agrocybe pediades TaxID=84607 RepID=A0A8H4VJT6_9AGAR|nr:hypothetical protein D9613_004270 [Agrocybe pediades]